MVEVSYVGVTKEKKPSEGKVTPFSISGAKVSPYTISEGEQTRNLSWQEVTDQVSMLMIERGMVWKTTAEQQRLLPALIFGLANELETAKKEVEPKRKK